MELMKLVAKLQLDDSGYRSGLDSAEAKGAQFTKGLSAMTVAAGQIIADIAMKTVAAIKDMIGGAIDAFADYQQLVGGIETLFKSSSGKMEEYAKNSFRTTGLSANKYMETAMSFSATLLQGVKGDTEKAADYTNMAILDMADNANKMGTDMGLLQNAYAGFAKRNYTMLDNLKLGYGGTESEMIRLVNDSHILDHEITSLDEITFDQLILAIHTVQTEMGITGTTAKEAEETITGSAASMKAAWEDLLAAVGGAGDQGRLDQAMQNFKESFATYMENFIPTLTTTIANSGVLIEAIAESIASLPSNLMANLAGAALGTGTSLLQGAEVLMNWLIDQLAGMVANVAIDQSSLERFGGALGHFLGSTVSNLLTKFPEFTLNMLQIGVTLAGSILAGIWDGLFGSGADGRLQDIEDEMNKTIVDATVSAARANAILDNMERLYHTYGDAARSTDEWKRNEEELEKVLGGSGEVFAQYGEDVEGAITHVRGMTEELRKLAIMNALQKRRDDEIALLGEFEAQKIEAQTDIDTYKIENETLKNQLVESTKAYALQMLMDTRERDMGFLHFVNPFNTEEVGREMTYSADRWRARELLLNGQVYTNRGLINLEDATANDWRSAGLTYAGILQDQNWGNGPGVYDKDGNFIPTAVWDDRETDNIVDPGVFKGLSEQIQQNDREIGEANKKLREAQEGIDKTTESLHRAELAYERGYQELDQFSQMAHTASVSLAGLQNIKIPATEDTSFWGQFTGAYAPKAIGMDYVPYDGFRAELHRGEAVLTAQQNADRGKGTFDMEYALENAVRSGMSGMYLNMDGNRVADMTTRRTRRNISANEHARVRAMGG